MKILSWDVGIYNLSYCIIEKNDNLDPKVIGWDIVNLVDNELMKKNRNLLFENIPRKLHEIPELLNVDYVVIENQPSLKNPQMKSIQMILYSYFLILGKVIGNGENSISYIDKIDFCSASNKLKVYDGPKIILEEKKTKKGNKQQINNDNNVVNEIIINNENNILNENNVLKENNIKKSNSLKYADKKRLAIEHARYYIEKYNPEYINFFNEHKKKDDLSDSFLQGLYYIKNLKV
jgi:hypothetical protein